MWEVREGEIKRERKKRERWATQNPWIDCQRRAQIVAFSIYGAVSFSNWFLPNQPPVSDTVGSLWVACLPIYLPSKNHGHWPLDKPLVVGFSGLSENTIPMNSRWSHLPFSTKLTPLGPYPMSFSSILDGSWDLGTLISEAFWRDSSRYRSDLWKVRPNSIHFSPYDYPRPLNFKLLDFEYVFHFTKFRVTWKIYADLNST